MATYKTKAFIIKRQNFGEADRIISLFSRDYGKIKVIAKGVRKPLSKLGGHLELFYFCDFVLTEGKNLETVCGAQIIECFSDFRKNLYATHHAYYLAELIDKLVHENYESKEIFDLFYKSIALLNQYADTFEVNGSKHLGGGNLLLRYFELQLLSQLGHRPEVEHCVKCHGKLIPEGIFWSNELGGALCEDCRQYSEVFLGISSDVVKLMRLFLSSDISAVRKLNLHKKLEKELENVIEGFLRYVSEKEFNTKKYVREK
ncbi:DNA repair protein RecO [Candidatus Berkelbacteria bacterium RIFCSPHIGHO2_12_FULL_36_9]|uniref:DNA repair protein RecO n=1 Tax=Candidatus Berkelbacteria bacterium RIFCSPHIGHO2_12_FULL_36_9 TaxID=1797469 RepID=A0A1F5EET7_9BACT|nr:MAG: DNA repair protein RecO [Candidatus Berkelbacteria bacterium RIFCSPHIGHO2_12_FULL_36_9]